MATIDLQGGKLDLRVSPPNGIKLDCQYTSDGTTAEPLTDATVTGYLMDDSFSVVASYTMTITDAAAGEFDLIFPARAFTDRWGCDMSYVVHAQFASESAPTPLMHGVIRIQEAR